jgi:hypothetical protein
MTFDSNEKVVSILRALNTHGIYSKQFTVSPDRAAIQNSHSEVYFEIKKYFSFWPAISSLHSTDQSSILREILSA